jgi:hypothetical protein
MAQVQNAGLICCLDHDRLSVFGFFAVLVSPVSVYFARWNVGRPFNCTDRPAPDGHRARRGGAPKLFLVVTRMGLAGFHGVMIALVTVSARKMGVMGGGDGVLRFEIPLCFTVMLRGFFVMVRRVMMMASSRMCTGHDPPEIFHRCRSLLDAGKTRAPFLP